MKTLIVKRPWGQFEQFSKNEVATVKLHTLNPRSSWSLQYHEKRSEFYKIISGAPVVTIDDKKILSRPGEEFVVPLGVKHRIETGEDGAVILEICYGDFEENDEVRLEDKYGRV